MQAKLGERIAKAEPLPVHRGDRDGEERAVGRCKLRNVFGGLPFIYFLHGVENAGDKLAEPFKIRYCNCPRQRLLHNRAWMADGWMVVVVVVVVVVVAVCVGGEGWVEGQPLR